ncbi:hypothetical protein RA276_28630, partial [Pseudomonas syringae pv. tagetis]
MCVSFEFCCFVCCGVVEFCGGFLGLGLGFVLGLLAGVLGSVGFAVTGPVFELLGTPDFLVL